MCTTSLIVFKLLTPKINKIENNNKNYFVEISGAVKNPGTYKFDKPKTLREIIFVANTLSNADIKTLELEKIINNDFEINIPYKVGTIKKIKWKDLHSVDQLIPLGIKSSIAQMVLKHRRENEKTSWEQILAIKGIGQVTLTQLKELIDLS